MAGSHAHRVSVEAALAARRPGFEDVLAVRISGGDIHRYDRGIDDLAVGVHRAKVEFDFDIFRTERAQFDRSADANIGAHRKCSIASAGNTFHTDSGPFAANP